MADAVPPELEELTYVKVLGSGGYSDVFLYEMHTLDMKVAVKVLKDPALTEAERAQFTAEAQAMARLSHHPRIVPIQRVGVAPDGRPYIVMKYFAGDNYAVRAKSTRLPLSEVLKTSIRIACALETAHRAGLLHRDIKPANILSDQFDYAALTDFGIASVATEADGAEGMSPPWSPPEVLFGTAPQDVRSDVYSLAATVWTLLVGRSPFEDPGGDNSSAALMRRIQTRPVPPTGRGDVPDSLERVLRTGMAKDPEHRLASALSLARALQEIERELHLPLTALELEDQSRDRMAAPPPAPTPTADHDETNLRPQVVHAQPETVAADRTARRAADGSLVSSVPAAATASAPSSSRVPQPPPVREPGQARVPQPPRAALDQTERAKPAADAPPAGPEPEHTGGGAGNRKWLLAGLVGAVVLAVAGAVALSMGGGSEGNAGVTTQEEVVPQDPAGSPTPGKPVVHARVRNGSVAFTWAGYTDALDTDTFRWRQSGTGKPQQGVASTPSLSVGAAKTDQVCLTVQVIRADGSSPSPLSDVTCSS